MPIRLSRRGFLKLAAGSGVAVGLSPKVRRILLEPFVRPPEEELPGRATWYASTCRQCPAGCGIIVRVINGRPRKIEGNPSHPLNRGKLCARGQAGLQVLYNPDRLRNAVRQTGGRGSRHFEPIGWDEALDQLASTLAALQDPQRVAFLGGLIPDHLHQVVSRFLQALGAPPPVVFDLHSAVEGRAQAAAMAQRWFGRPQLPIYDIARAGVVLSFGANLFETWMSPVAQSIDFGTMRQAQRGGRGFLAQFEPRLSATGASADEWIPVRPGTEGLVALGLGRIIVEQELGRVGSHREHASLYADVSVSEIADASGVSAEKLVALARIFADADRSVAIPGGYLTGLTKGERAMDAVMALNVIMRRLGQEGGVFFPHDVPAQDFSSSVLPSDFSDLERLVERMRTGGLELLFVHSVNPLYELPRWTGFLDALENVPTVVSFSPMVDETSVRCDWLLPDHTYLEGWGYQVVAGGGDRPTVSGLQPVVEPLYDTRSSTDVLLALASRLGGEVAQALPWPDEAAFLEEASAQLFGSSLGAYEAQTAGGFWSRWRQFGGWWSEKPILGEPEATIPTGPLRIEQPQFSGSEEEFPLHLVPYESISLSEGRGANQPWLQELPDPMTTARWNTWVEVNPLTATQLGVRDNDRVRIVSLEGQMEASVVVYPGIRPDAVAIPMGQGHSDYGRFAQGRGANVVGLIAPLEPGRLAWASTRVRLERVPGAKPLARLESLDGQGRESLR